MRMLAVAVLPPGFGVRMAEAAEPLIPSTTAFTAPLGAPVVPGRLTVAVTVAVLP